MCDDFKESFHQFPLWGWDGLQSQMGEGWCQILHSLHCQGFVGCFGVLRADVGIHSDHRWLLAAAGALGGALYDKATGPKYSLKAW